ncbi:zinc ribbon domain-containing protein [Desulfomonile tiedjei]|nr:zinc ribbon domain-containing protein [Desulfomonile tiedjei]
MPIYEFVCVECEASRDVLADTTIKNEMELICVHCGGVMRAAQVSRFSVISSSAGAGKGHVHADAAKSCGHTHACRCAVKMTKTNPFQDRIDLALGNVKPE